MQLVIQYAELYLARALSPADDSGDIPATVEDIAGLLYCTERNVKKLLKRMVEHRWIAWMPGRGRGNRSHIRFLASLEELLMDEAKRYVEQGNIKAAMNLFQLPKLDPALSERFLALLGNYFGYKEHDLANPGCETLCLPLRSTLLTLDPADVFFSRDLHFVRQLFDTLVRFDPERNRLEPHLAHHWECDESGTIWTFYLRKGILFHHGREMKASDVIYSWMRLTERDEMSTNRWLAEHIQTLTELGPYTIRVQLNEPNHMFVNYVGSYSMSVVPEDVYRSRKDTSRHAIGTGPFRIARHDEGMLVLEAFAPYFRGRAHLDRIELLYLPNGLQDMTWKDASFHIGKTHHFQMPVPSDWKTANTLTQGCSLLAFNLRKPGPQQDPAFREAIHRALERKGMIKALGMANAVAASGFIPPASPVWNENDHDLEAAQRLIESSDYRGQTLRLVTMPKSLEQCEWIRERCRLIGIEMDIVELTYMETARPTSILDGDCMFGGVVADDDIELFLVELYKMGNLVIRVYATDEQRIIYDQRVADIVAVRDASLRMERINKMSRLLQDDYRVLFIAHSSHETVFAPGVKGVTLNTFGWFDFKNIWFKPLPKPLLE